MNSAHRVCLLSVLATHAACGGSPPCERLSSIIPTDSVTQDTTVPEGCWLAERDVYVSDGATLTAAPGATVKFDAGLGIHVNADGALSAAGTSDKPIVFTGREAVRGFWSGITFTNSPSDKNNLSHVTVEYAGADEHLDDGARPFRAAVLLDSSGYEVRARITHTTIRESSGFGLFVDHTAVIPEFAGNTITKNASGAVYVYAAAVHNLASTSDYRGNDADQVFVNAAYEFGDKDRTWAALGAPYTVDGVFILYRHLTIAQGTTLRFTKGSGIRVLDGRGGVSAVGTREQPIVFAGTASTPGHWNGLYWANTNDAAPASPRTRLEYVTVEHGGAYSFLDSNADEVRGNLMLDSSGWGVAIRLGNATVRSSTGWGVWLDCRGTLSGGGNTFGANDWGDQAREKNCP